MSKASLRKGAWTKATRNKLSAIVEPHKSDPPDFHLSLEAAWARICERQRLDDVTMPEGLTRADELAREKWFGSWVGVSWMGSRGRVFSEEYYNELVAFWSQRESLTWVVEFLLGEDGELAWPFYAADQMSFFAALRRYLFHVDRAEFDATLAAARPIFDALGAARFDDYEKNKLYCGLAFAFSREPTMICDAIRAHLADNKHFVIDISQALCVCGDPELALEYRQRHSGKYDAMYYVFDLVEVLGSGAIPVLEAWETTRAPERKRLASALKIARKAEELGW